MEEKKASRSDYINSSRVRRRKARFLKKENPLSNTLLQESRVGSLVNQRLSFDHFPFRLEGIEVKRTSRWIDGPQLISEYNIPYIDKWGRISGSTFATVRCSPQQFVATIVATVTQRLKRIATRYNGHGAVIRNSKLLVKAAYYYAVSKNDWFRSRFVELSKSIRENRRIMNGLTFKFLAKMDDYTRFVYSQVYFQTNWLFSRAQWPRDKSRFFSKSKTFHESGLKGTREQWRALRMVSVRISSMCPNHFKEVKELH